jgi:hypothetical protein
MSKPEVSTIQPTIVAAPAKCAICGKPLTPGNTSGTGSTCSRHLGKVAKYYLPATTSAEHLLPITVLCDIAEKLGKSRGFAVNLCGGDAGTFPPKEPIFQVYKIGTRKYLDKAAGIRIKEIITGK